MIGWRAVQAIGLAGREIAGSDPEYVRIHLRRLSWLVNDESGGIGWRAPEAMGEIIARSPGMFDEFIPPLFHLLDMEVEDAPRFRAGVLWAIGRVGADRPEALAPVLGRVLGCLDDADPQVRGLAIWCLGQCGFAGPIQNLDALRKDQTPLSIYRVGKLVSTTVASLAAVYAR